MITYNRLQTSITSGRLLASVRLPAVTTTLTNVVILGGSTLTGIVSARELGPSGRGQLAVVILWSGLISMVGMLGMPSACCYYLAQWPKRRATLTMYFRKVAIWQALVITAISALVLCVLHFRLRTPTILTIEYISWPAAASLALYGTCFVQGKGEFGRFNTIRLISGGVSVIPMFLMALTVHLTPTEAGAAYLVPLWCSAALAWRWLHQDEKTANPDARPLTRHERRAIQSYGLRSVASLSSLTLNRSADQLIIGLLVPVRSLGIYSVSASASSPLPTLIASLGMVGLPKVAALNGQAKTVATWHTLGRAAWLLLLAGPACGAVLPWAIPAVYGSHYAAAVIPSELLLIGAIFAAPTTVTDDLLRAHGYPGFVSITQGAGALVTIVGTLLFANHSLAAVALISSLGFVISFVLALARLFAATRKAQGQHRKRRIPQQDAYAPDS